MMKKSRFNILRTSALPVIFTLIMLTLNIRAEAKDIFADLAGMAGVESTYVSGRFAHNKQSWKSNSGLHGIDLSRGFSALYSYECYSEEAVRKARAILKNLIKNDPDLELMMKTTQGSQEYLVYEKFNDEGNLIQMLIWNSDAPHVCEIVVIDWKEGLKRDSSYKTDSFGRMLIPTGAFFGTNGNRSFK